MSREISLVSYTCKHLQKYIQELKQLVNMKKNGGKLWKINLQFCRDVCMYDLAHGKTEPKQTIQLNSQSECVCVFVWCGVL